MLFTKGVIPWNKGIKTGIQPKGGFGTRFTKGHKKSCGPRKPGLHRTRIRIKPIIKNEKEYSPYWHEIRKIVYKRDNWTCQECGVHCHADTKIQAHHIDYDTNNNDLTNLITLCVSCHCKTNFRRADWIIRYTRKAV